MRSTDTIFALSTGRLPSGIAIVRMSGPGVRIALEAVAGAVPRPRVARYGPLTFRGELLDHGLSLFFPGPASATGEDCGEFQVHGSVAVVKGLIAALSSLDGFRLAEPGEFSRRGFLNGRMDLTAVESLSDLIAAETDQQRKLALAGMGGKLRDTFLEWRAELQSLRARIEAELDFSDQDDVSPDLNAAIGREINSLTMRIDQFVGRLGQATPEQAGIVAFLESAWVHAEDRLRAAVEVGEHAVAVEVDLLAHRAGERAGGAQCSRHAAQRPRASSVTERTA